LRKYERELKRLRSELAEKSKNVVDKRRLLEVEEKRRRAEQDKLAAITALEQRSRSLMQEKKEKGKLEDRIKHLQGQLLVGGGDECIEDAAAFRCALQQEHLNITREYEERLNELERERQTLDEDKAQVDRYKQLLVKQRDIMVALTLRLNERDETVSDLQEEMDAYDQHQQLMEEGVDKKTALIISLQKAAAQHHQQRDISTPEFNVGTDSGAHATDTLALEMCALEAEFKEVEAEKESLEYLLKEKLEKMVQVEIEERVNLYRQQQLNGGSMMETLERTTNGVHLETDSEFRNEFKVMTDNFDQDEQRLVQQLKEKERQLFALEAEQQSLHDRGNRNGELLSQALSKAEQTRTKLKQDYEEELSGFFRDKREEESKWRNERQGQLAEMMALKQQCATNEKERVALKTILELKIKGLVDGIARSVSEKAGAGSAQMILREVQALQKLVNASAAALGFRN